MRQFEMHRTGRLPTSVNASLVDDALVVTLRGVLSPAEMELAKTVSGAASLRELHRQLFSVSSVPLWREIKAITGVAVVDATSEVAMPSGTVVQVFRLAESGVSSTGSESGTESTWIDPSHDRKEDDVGGES